MTSQSSDADAPWEDATEDAASGPVAARNDDFAEFAPPAGTGDDQDSFDQEDADDAPVPPEKEPLIDEIASEFVGFWNLLVSRTNWEKGKVIHSWREKLIEAGLPRRIYSDDAIAQRIGNVSPQHVGRLRRVFERFGGAEPLPNLYWSHYQAALDWDDAGEWLEKASAEKLSVAQTRMARWEALGLSLQSKPKEDDIVDSEKDEDVNPYNDSNVEPDAARPETADGGADASQEKKKKKPKQEPGEDLGEYSGEEEPWEKDGPAPQTVTTNEVLNAISQLDELPGDFAEAFEAVKIAILSRKISGWADVQPVQVAAYLSEMKRLLVCKDGD